MAPIGLWRTSTQTSPMDTSGSTRNHLSSAQSLEIMMPGTVSTHVVELVPSIRTAKFPVSPVALGLTTFLRMNSSVIPV